MRILYFGLPLGAIILRKHGFVPSLLCIGHQPAVGWSRLRREHEGLILMRPDLSDPGIVSLIQAHRPDLLLSFFWPEKLPNSILSLAPAYGTHPSLLPRWRGPDPTFWTIKTGDSHSGVTLHRLDSDYDTGEIVAQVRLPVAAKSTAWQLAKSLDRPALSLLTFAATRAQQRLPLKTRPQIGEVMMAPSPSEMDLSIDWKGQSADEILRLIRACTPFGALAKLGTQECEIVGATRWEAEVPAVLVPSEACFIQGHLVVVTQRGAISVHAVQVAGEDVPLTKIRQWLAC